MNDERMGNKKILPLLIEFSVPAIIGMLVNAIIMWLIECLLEMRHN